MNQQNQLFLRILEHLAVQLDLLNQLNQLVQSVQLGLMNQLILVDLMMLQHLEVLLDR
jgi:hypothetical protein